jgi:RNA polymerase sigma-70 factor (ECF subfamily)
MAAGLNDTTDVVVVDDVESVFRAHYGRLVRALTVVAGSRELASDAVQEAFVKAHLHWRRVQHYDDPVAWIRRVAINKLRDEHRRTRRKRAAVQRMEARPAQPDEADAWHSDEVATWLASLPRQQRLALALFYVSELSVAEVAAALEISDGAVKYHLHQGRERLRVLIGTGADG